MGKKAKTRKPDTQPAAGTKYPPATAPQLERLRALLLELERFRDSAHPDAGAVFQAMRALSWTGYPVPPGWRMEAWQGVSFPKDDRMVYYLIAGMNAADVEAMIRAAGQTKPPDVLSPRAERVHEYLRGRAADSRQAIATALAMSVRNVGRALAELQKAGRVERRKGGGYFRRDTTPTI